MSGWDISPLAEAEYLAAVDLLSDRSREAAERFMAEFVATGDRLGSFPDSGHHPSLPADLRCVRVQEWLAIYARVPGGIRFVHVLPARADLARYSRESQAAYLP